MVAFGRRVEPASLDRVDAAMKELKEARLEKISQFKKFFDRSDEIYKSNVRTYGIDIQNRTLEDILRKGGEMGIFSPDPAISIPSEATYFTADLRLQGFHKWHDRVNSGFGRLARGGMDRYAVRHANSILQEALTVLYQNEEKILKDATHATRNAASGDEVNRISMLEFKQTNGMERILVGVADYLGYGYSITPAAATGIIRDMVALGNGVAFLKHVSERRDSF